MIPRGSLENAEFIEAGARYVLVRPSGLIFSPVTGSGIAEAGFATTVGSGLVVYESKKNFDGDPARLRMIPREKLLKGNPELRHRL
jgi:hypothetical protein